MKLTVTGKKLDTRPLYGLLTQGEKNIDNPTITMPRIYDGVDISALDYEIQAYSPKDTMVTHPLAKQVTDTEVTLTWEVSGEFTAVAGPIWLVITGTDANNEKIIIITADEVVVNRLPQGQWQPPPPDLLASTLAQMISIKAATIQSATNATNAAGQAQAAAAKAEAASAAMPYVGEDGYWYTWDNTTGKFVKTNVPKDHSHEMSEVRGLSTTMATKADISEVCRPNLLINGGFQVWQRGNSFPGIVSSVKRYCVDGWRATSAQTIEKMEVGLKSTLTQDNTATTWLEQVIEYTPFITGETVTFAVRLKKSKSNLQVRVTLYCGEVSLKTVTANSTTDYQTLLASVAVPASYTNATPIVMSVITDTSSGSLANGDWVELKCAKLEQSAPFTGFYPEDPATALARCQRYQIIGVGARGFPASIGPNDIEFIVPVPTRMRIPPTFVGTFEVLSNSSARIDGFSVSGVYLLENAVQVKLAKTAHGLTFSELGTIKIGSGSGFDANL